MLRFLLALASTTSVLVPSAGSAEGFRVIGHRGAAGGAPENTLPALERARTLGAREVEVDVRRSRDGRLVLFHDGTLDAKTDLAGPVSEQPLAALLAADIGSWFDRTHPEAKIRYAGTGPTTPEAAFATFGTAFFWHVEIKGREPQIPRQVVEAIRQAGLTPNAMVTSFDEAQLLRVQMLAPGLPLCQLAHRTRPGRKRPSPEEVIENAAKRRFAMVAIAADELSEEHIAMARERKLTIRAFGVEDDDQLVRVIMLGADGATVDHPDRALALLERIQQLTGPRGPARAAPPRRPAP